MSEATATAKAGKADHGSVHEGPQPDFDKLAPKRSYIAARKRADLIFRILIYVAFAIACIPLISVLWTTIANGVTRLNLNFLSVSMNGIFGGSPLPNGSFGGVFHAIIGTLEITFGAMVISIPVGILAAVYLIEYSNNGKLSVAVRFLVDVMSGIPSIVAGLFAFTLFLLIVGPDGAITGFTGSVALSLLMIPTVVKTCEEMLKVVPNDLREASYALGVTKQRTITKIVLRTALPGIVSGVILAIARVIGETAPLIITSGYIDTMNFNLFSGRMTTLPVYVYNQWSLGDAVCPAAAISKGCLVGINSERAWAAALVLIIIVLLLNLLGRLVAKVFAIKGER